MKLKQIYKKTVTGAIQIWEIEIESNKYRTIHGQISGKQQISEWTVCEGKNIGKSNETTPEAQALKEAQALRQKKLEKDYKENKNAVSDIDYFKPMLAYEYVKGTVFNDVTFSQPKLDGIRAETQKDSIKSRNGKKFVSVPHIFNIATMVFNKYPTLVLDGELYNHKYKDNFNQITSIVKKTKPTKEDLILSEKYMQYWVYDLYFKDTPNMLFAERRRMLKRIFDEFGLEITNSFVFVPTVKIIDTKHLNDMFEHYLEKGYEGQIIRRNQPYQNKRTKFLLKRKEFMTEEFVVMDIVEGVGNRTGTAGYITAVTKDGKPFRSNIKGSFEYLTEILKNKRKYLGTEATIRFFRYTPDGIPRFPYVIAFDRSEIE